jgi:transcriptional regulator with XRE-family HTH domain
MLSYRIKFARLQQGMNQVELAEKLNVTRTAVVNWETGYAKPKDETIELISTILKVSVDWLLDTSKDDFEMMEESIDDSKEWTFKKKIGARLRYFRKKNGLTQENVSNVLHIDHTLISNYEIGRSEPNFEILVKLADIYNLSLDHLLGRNKTKFYIFDVENEEWFIEILSAEEKKKDALKKMWVAIKDL